MNLQYRWGYYLLFTNDIPVDVLLCLVVNQLLKKPCKYPLLKELFLRVKISCLCLLVLSKSSVKQGFTVQ